MSKEKQIETTDWLTKGISKEQLEREKIAAILAQNFTINDERYDASDFEWAAHCLICDGYRKQSEGEWTYSENKKTMKCTMCRLRMKTYDVRRYCPNCGAKMKGGAE